MSTKRLLETTVLNQSLALRAYSLEVEDMEVNSDFIINGVITYATDAQTVAKSGTVVLTSPYTTLTITGLDPTSTAYEYAIIQSTFLSSTTGVVGVKLISCTTANASPLIATAFPLVSTTLLGGVWYLVIGTNKATAVGVPYSVVVQVEIGNRS